MKNCRVYSDRHGLELPYLRRSYFDIHNDGSQGGLGQLRRVVDGVCVQSDQLEGAGQLKDTLDLTLHLG